MTPIFDIDTVRRGDAVIVLVRGEIDLASAHHLDTALTEAEATDAKTLVIDLERVSFMDATGLGVIVRHASMDQQAAKRIRLTPGPPQVQRLFDLAGLRAELPFGCLN